MKRIFAMLAFTAMFGLNGLAAQEMGDGESTPAEPPKTDEKPAEKKPEEKRPEGRRGEGRRAAGSVRGVAAILEARDKDGDRKLSKEEFGNDELFAKLDKDSDGNLTVQEMSADPKAIEEEMVRANKAAATEEFRALDRDDSGKLNAEELGERKNMIEVADKDKDGEINLDEYVAGKEVAARAAQEEKAKKAAEEAWKNLDKDGDGKLTGDEIPARLKENLARVDTDGDGAISKEEMEAVQKRMREGGKGGKGGEGGKKRPQQN